MDYMLVLIGGMVGGILLPKKITSMAVALLVGAVSILYIVFVGISSSYSANVLTNLLLLREAPGLDRTSLLGVGVTGYTCIMAGLVGAVRLLLDARRRQAP